MVGEGYPSESALLDKVREVLIRSVEKGGFDSFIVEYNSHLGPKLARMVVEEGYKLILFLHRMPPYDALVGAHRITYFDPYVNLSNSIFQISSHLILVPDEKLIKRLERARVNVPTLEIDPVTLKERWMNI